MRKIHVTLQFFEASGRHEDFFEKTKYTSEIRSILDQLLASRGFRYLAKNHIAKKTKKYLSLCKTQPYLGACGLVKKLKSHTRPQKTPQPANANCGRSEITPLGPANLVSHGMMIPSLL